MLLISQTDLVLAQLESCTDIGCPMALGGYFDNCTVGGNNLIYLGISGFQTELAADPLSWTVGYVPQPRVRGYSENTRVYYLGQPPSVNLRENSSVTACALFFNGIGSHLKPNSSGSGTCNDVLSAQCIADLTQEAQEVAGNTSAAEFSCDGLAKKLKAPAPASCTIGQVSWGAVAAQGKSEFPLSSTYD